MGRSFRLESFADLSPGTKRIYEFLAEDPADFRSPPDESDRAWCAAVFHLKALVHCLAGIKSINKINCGLEYLQRMLAADEMYRRAIRILRVLRHESDSVDIDEIAV